MKIIILAAGKGERLMPLTKNTPKPLLDMGNGNTLIEEQIQSIRESGVIDEIVLIVGYLADQIESKLKRQASSALRIKTVYNPFFEVSNNLMSLWLAGHEMEYCDFMVTNGDNLFTPDVFRDMVEENENGTILAVSADTLHDYDDMKVSIEDGLVAWVSKEIPREEADAHSPGLAMVRGSRERLLFREHLEILARDNRYMNKFWLETFNLLHDRGVPVYPWYFDGRTRWQEIDFHADVEKVRSVLRPKFSIVQSEVATGERRREAA